VTVWVVWQGSHEEIAAVCATEERAKQWVREEAEKTRTGYRKERDRRLAARAELEAMTPRERLRLMGLHGYGEVTLEERVKYAFTQTDFYDPGKVKEEDWPIEEEELLT
jgi:hypothetical protein